MSINTLVRKLSGRIPDANDLIDFSSYQDQWIAVRRTRVIASNATAVDLVTELGNPETKPTIVYVDEDLVNDTDIFDEKSLRTKYRLPKDEYIIGQQVKFKDLPGQWVLCSLDKGPLNSDKQGILVSGDGYADIHNGCKALRDYLEANPVGLHLTGSTVRFPSLPGYRYFAGPDI